jgi:cytochrome c553
MRVFRLWPIGWFIVAALPIAAHAASVVEQVYTDALRSKADIVHGQALFATCAACHGADGAGVADGSVPAIAGQHFRVIVRELVDFRYDKRWHELMEHYADEHNLGGTQNLADVATYISALRPTRTAGTGNGQSVDTGAQLYARACASCHGRAAKGEDRNGYPRLAGQHYEYLLQQIDDAVQGRRPNFSREHVRLLARFERDDRAAIADYLSRLDP